MSLSATMTVRALLRDVPFAEDVLAHHGITLEPEHHSLTLYALCWTEGIEYGDVFADLQKVLADEDLPERWPDVLPRLVTDEELELGDTDVSAMALDEPVPSWAS